MEDKQLSKFQRWLILFNVSVSIFMCTLDGSIVNIALPIISKNLSASISSVQWIVTSYLLTISVLLLIWGKISDLYGKKKVFALGFIIFTIGSGLCSLSHSLEMLVFSRILQAIGASSAMALGQGIVTAIFPPSERGRALGITGTTVAIGSLVGPGLGGVLTQFAGWQSIFSINIPIGIIGTILTFAIIPELRETTNTSKFDFKGAVLLSVSIILLFASLLFAQDGKISLLEFAAMAIIAAVGIFFFIRNEKKAPSPLINLNLFKSHVFSMGISSAFLSFVATFSTIMFMPFYLQGALGLKPLPSGILMSFYPAVTALFAPISGWLSDKISYRPLTVAGLAINTVTLFTLAAIGPSTPHVVIAILMALLGLGTAIFQSPNNSSVMGSVPRDQLGVAGGINALFRNLGMVSGVAVSVMLFTFSAKLNINSLSSTSGFKISAFMHGFQVVMVFAGLSCLLALIISLTRSVGIMKVAGEKSK